MLEHGATPGWLCYDCPEGTLWPCPPAQKRILAEGGAPGFMATLAFAAIEDLPHEDARGLYARFTEWTRPAA